MAAWGGGARDALSVTMHCAASCCFFYDCLQSGSRKRRRQQPMACVAACATKQKPYNGTAHQFLKSTLLATLGIAPATLRLHLRQGCEQCGQAPDHSRHNSSSLRWAMWCSDRIKVSAKAAVPNDRSETWEPCLRGVVCSSAVQLGLPGRQKCTCARFGHESKLLRLDTAGAPWVRVSRQVRRLDNVWGAV